MSERSVASRSRSRKSSPVELGDIDLGIQVSPKKWNKKDLDYLFSSVAMKEYIDRMNALILPEISKKHIVFKLNENGLPRVMINNKEAFRADFGFDASSPFAYVEVSTPSVYMDKIEIRWWIRRHERGIYFSTYGTDPTINETRLAHVLLMICIFQAFGTIHGVDLTFGGTLPGTGALFRVNYLAESGNAVSATYMKEIKNIMPKFIDYIQKTMLPPEHEEQLTDYKRRIGELLVKQITDKYAIPQSGGRRKQVQRKRKNVKKVSK